MTAHDDSAFLDRVAERARIPVGDAEGLVRDFMKALSAVVDREAWSLVRGLVPEETEISWEDGAGYQESRSNSSCSKFPNESLQRRAVPQTMPGRSVWRYVRRRLVQSWRA